MGDTLKLNNKGFAISSIMYIILVLAVILISLILVTLSSRKLILDKLRKEVLTTINEAPNITYRQTLKQLKNETISYMTTNSLEKESIKVDNLNSSIDSQVLEKYKLNDKYLVATQNTDSYNVYLGKEKTITDISKPIENLIDIIDYKIYGNSVQDILPGEYQQVEYIQSDGNQYIDTKYIPTVNDVYKIKFLQTNIADNQVIFGSRTSGTYKDSLNQVYLNKSSALASTDRLLFFSGIVLQDLLLTENNKIYELELDVNSGDFNNTSNQALYLFGLNNMGSALAHSKIRMYEFKIYNNDILVRDFIPCYRKSDSTIGMYDLIENNFYTNQGTGSFAKGSDSPTPDSSIDIKSVGELALPSEYQEVEYIESTGTQYINTNYIDVADTRVELDFVYTGRTGTLSYMGANGGNVLAIGNNDYISINAKSTGITPTVGERYKITSYRGVDDMRTATMNGVEYIGTKARQNQLYYIFTLGGQPNSNQRIYGRLYSCKIYYQDKLVRDLIPCYRKSDGVIGAYDVVNDVFYTNAGTGTFLKGNDTTNRYKIPVKVSKENLLKLKDGSFANTTLEHISKNQIITKKCISAVTTSYLLQTGPFDKFIGTFKLKAGTYIWNLYNVSGKPTITNPYIVLTTETETINWNANTPITLTEEATITQVRSDMLSYSAGSTQQFGIQIQEGDVFVEPKTTNIYIDEPLRKIDSYLDYIDFKSNKVVRNIHNEFITTVTSKSSLTGTFSIFLTDVTELPLTKNSGNNMIGYGVSNKFLQHKKMYKDLVDNGGYIQPYVTSKGVVTLAYSFNDATITTLEQAKEKIGDGFNVSYVLSTSKEESISLDKINTNIGSTKIFIDTDVLPSSYEFTIIEKIVEI